MNEAALSATLQAFVETEFSSHVDKYPRRLTGSDSSAVFNFVKTISRFPKWVQVLCLSPAPGIVAMFILVALMACTVVFTCDSRLINDGISRAFTGWSPFLYELSPLVFY
jgi:hypothetical protein